LIIANTWYFVAAGKTLSSNMVDGFAIVVPQNAAPSFVVTPALPASATIQQGTLTTFQPYIALGGAINWATRASIPSTSFNGVLKEFKIFARYNTWQYLYANAFRLNSNFGSDNPYLVSYWRLNSSFTFDATNVTLYDSSSYQLTATISQLDFPKMIQVSDSRADLELCLYKDIGACISIFLLERI
jgi:hypothetical protein